ncbi:MAG: membrane protein insertase YidC [Desulfobacterota bacterium]|nr:membrane protein insertase YidC [Thermodesulfobacteriota bacterium]MDW8002620.1 membrane protein insertase YidC [Deltaproteobacteria bacterium]
MEKRVILAFILMLLVLFIFQVYFTPKPQEPSKKTEKKPVEKKIEGERFPKKVTPLRFSPKEIVVENSVFRVTFTEAGGGIKSVKLKGYKESIKEEKEKELIEDIKPYSSIPALGFLVEDRLQEEPVCQGPSHGLVVKDSPKEITFVCSLSNGGSVTKTYKIYPSEYYMDFKIDTDTQTESTLGLDIAAISATKKTHTFKGPFVFDGKNLEQIEKVERKITPKKDYKYAGLDEGYFAIIWIPEDKKPELLITKTEENVPAVRLLPKGEDISGKLFFGPKKTEILKALNVKAEKIIDFGWFDLIAKPLVAILNFSHKLTGNYGVDIIILTILIKILFHPLTVKSYKSMKEMQKLQPQIAKLREKYKDNREKLNQELMELYRRRGINPMSGCLPILIQIPVFFALYKALTGAIELRHAPFVLWIKDLSEPEDLFSIEIAGFSIPVRVLPLVMGITQVIQQKMTPTGGDPLQEKIMLLMPIFFTFLFWGFPSGLVLYWLVNNVVSIFQQLIINKKVK